MTKYVKKIKDPVIRFETIYSKQHCENLLCYPNNKANAKNKSMHYKCKRWFMKYGCCCFY
jgi:hypothetical protein